MSKKVVIIGAGFVEHTTFIYKLKGNLGWKIIPE